MGEEERDGGGKGHGGGGGGGGESIRERRGVIGVQNQR